MLHVILPVQLVEICRESRNQTNFSFNLEIWKISCVRGCHTLKMLFFFKFLYFLRRKLHKKKLRSCMLKYMFWWRILFSRDFIRRLERTCTVILESDCSIFITLLLDLLKVSLNLRGLSKLAILLCVPQSGKRKEWGEGRRKGGEEKGRGGEREGRENLLSLKEII